MNLKFPNQKERDKFIELFGPLAKSVAAKERGVLGYELSIADNDPLKVVIFERYDPAVMVPFNRQLILGKLRCSQPCMMLSITICSIILPHGAAPQIMRRISSFRGSDNGSICDWFGRIYMCQEACVMRLDEPNGPLLCYGPR